MSDLLERTRLATLERVRSVRRTLETARDGTDPAVDSALRELHAIKGDTAMGGHASVSRLAHGLETLLIQRRGEESLYLDDIVEALRVLADVLANTSAESIAQSSDIQELLAEVEAAGAGGAGQLQTQPRSPVAALAGSGADASAAAAPEGGPGGAGSSGGGNGRQEWIRIDARSINDLSRLMSDASGELDGTRALLSELAEVVGRQAKSRLQALADQLDTVRSQLAHAEERAWSLRLVSLSPTLQDLEDHVEGLARQLGKNVNVEVRAHGVALERGVVEALREPLMHLARNAVDHGIEPSEQRGSKEAVGRIRFLAESQGSEIVIIVDDDGVGLDPEAIRSRAVELGLVTADRTALLSREEVLDLVFATGYSQRDEVSEISGRGVGLAAVRGSVEGLGGAVRVTSSPGRGTRFELVLAAAVARERVLMVEAAGLAWAIPSRWVRLVVRDPDALDRARRERMLRLQDGLVPARPLNTWLGAPREEETAAVVIEIAKRRTALLVARTEQEVDLLRAPTDPLAAAATRVAASGTLADGRVALFLRWAEVLREATQLVDDGAVAARKEARKVRVLVADDSPVILDIVSEVLGGAGIEVETATDGKIALELITRAEFDLVVTDIEMPRMTGLELLKAIREKTQTLPVVMLTTRSKPEHRREAALMGANAYIAKSEFHGDTLIEVVRRFVDVEV